MGTSTSTYEFLVRQNVSAYPSQLFKSFNVYLLQSKRYLFLIQVRPPLSHLANEKSCPSLDGQPLTLSRFLSAKLLHSNLIFVGLGSNHFEGNYHVLLRAEN